MGRMNRLAQAVIMDALIFLMVVSIVSVSLLSCLDRSEEENGAQQFVEAAHRILLHTTIHWNVSGQNQTVSEFILLFAKHLDAEAWEKEDESIKEVLDFVLIPRFDYVWRVECEKGVHCIGDVENHSQGDIYASSFVIDQSSGTVVVLQAWLRAA